MEKVLFVCVHNSARSQMAEGTREQKLSQVRRIRDQIRRQVLSFLQSAV